MAKSDFKAFALAANILLAQSEPSLLTLLGSCIYWAKATLPNDRYGNTFQLPTPRYEGRLGWQNPYGYSSQDGTAERSLSVNTISNGEVEM